MHSDNQRAIQHDESLKPKVWFSVKHFDEKLKHIEMSGAINEEAVKVLEEKEYFINEVQKIRDTIKDVVEEQELNQNCITDFIDKEIDKKTRERKILVCAICGQENARQKLTCDNCKQKEGIKQAKAKKQQIDEVKRHPGSQEIVLGKEKFDKSEHIRFEHVKTNHKENTELVMGKPVFVNPNSNDSVALVLHQIEEEQAGHLIKIPKSEIVKKIKNKIINEISDEALQTHYTRVLDSLDEDKMKKDIFFTLKKQKPRKTNLPRYKTTTENNKTLAVIQPGLHEENDGNLEKSNSDIAFPCVNPATSFPDGIDKNVWIAVAFENTWYPGLVESIEEDGLLVSCAVVPSLQNSILTLQKIRYTEIGLGELAMNAMEKILSFILLIILLTTVHVDGKPCSNSRSECQQIRMPLVSNKLNAPLVAELDVTSMNKQLETYIRDNIDSTFSEDIKVLVKHEQDDLKISMLQDYSSKLNSTMKEYDKHISNIVRILEAKQGELELEISDVNRNLSESESTFKTEITNLFSGFEQRQENLKLAMLSDYLSKLQQSQDANNKKMKDLASELKSQFADLTQEFREDLKEWKTNLMAALNDTYGSLKYKDCSYMRGKILQPSRVYTIYPDELNGIHAYCNMSTDGGGWTVIQRRIDGTTDFDRNWIDYKEGFGDSQKEYWLGNKYLNILTTNGKYELRVDLTDTNNKMTYALYKTFTVSDENSQYKLTIRGHSGTAHNYMSYNNGKKFSTKDRDHDTWGNNCAAQEGAWWHGYCSNSRLNYDMNTSPSTIFRTEINGIGKHRKEAFNHYKRLYTINWR
ncbi:Fibrinogen-like protein A,Ryncolin-4,Angiopoietin-related protein 1,Ficolin-3,Ficolin-1-B,Techylectin-5A,Ficolin-2,Ryncolin-1,Tenascin-R,Fibrinogen-like protein 1,Fibrinogen C domain-containing protein 1-A,Tenascin-N,Ryncolin-3,Tenascin,Fibroleukin,Fibrinogen C domain-containing protein 1,Ryncolin-2,Techylectin-5B,Angiopoietin-2,Microfibril-associated glycoprotein 4,Ficolin-1-A,Ficolin-1,Angiopoietin-4 [Mytilus coruscus]|uniref:Fibrinogen C-terminal domain-containing protein n=1 Tax=Mytilus coruscus TaxID=42192 RepID=A0A6J8C4D2_MYTCO|nr:Fibrinogen-like protein A,Ryncolin-4,Angiopoietin-related protein 1,Ficolin-3,Ficolin-1-B,Techylectin-5A,Ficolin-2,Ryncolin-1,Tenascin-R,Fibrinogen-like protein 1,Fibrinogen C domain-containing protein 1-A,Tenascin-N,Ryncolin-3,Tenascin,Fibroleukin,Fibrinogen C domain-containing protein 1,Ryncolin-2,Techylectin-5B,Angiopoietin-2,Microfibril-associated glycoprotein 4,Ficolin-1-A,Ficolin-1,Angiopoietin-4 [Mytilus coruscus]